MTRYPQPSSCLSPETLALMASGKLTPVERLEAEAHVATCADCYEVLMELAEAAPVARTSSRTRAIIVWSGIAASILAAAVIAPRVLGGRDRELANAVGSLAGAVGTARPTVGRLNGGFEWGDAPAITRGASTTELPLAVQDAVLAIKKLAQANRTARSMDAVGVASLVDGDLDASLAALDGAVALDPNDAHARGDLAAARFEKWRRSQAPVDATSALDAAQRALLIAPKDPVARFNHALAVEALGLTGAAKASWQAYLELDSKSKWADEAREHVARLGGGTAGGLPAADAGHDRYVPDLTAAIAASAGDPRRRDCLLRGRQSIDDSRAAFDASRTADAEQFAQAAKTAFACGGVPTIEADAQIVWTHYFMGSAKESAGLVTLVADAKRRGYLRAAGRIQYARGRLADNAAQLSDAQALFADARQLFQDAGDTELVASTSIQMAEITNDFGDPAGSWQALSVAMRAMPSLAPRRQHMTLSGATLAATRFGLDGAAQFFADALVNADEHNSTDAVLRTGAALLSARSAFRLGDSAGALERVARAKTSRDAIGDDALRTQYTAEIGELEGTILEKIDPRKSVAALSSAMTIFGDSGRPLRRAHLLLIRGRAYRAAGDSASAEKDWVDGAEIFEDQRPEIREAQNQIGRSDQMWDLFRELIALRASGGGDAAVASLEVAERFRARALLDALSKDRRAAPLAGDAMFRWLPAGVTVLAYAALPDQLFRWTISRDRVLLDRLDISAADLADLVDRQRSAITRRGVAPDADVTKLSELLLPKSLDPKTTTRLVFLPDGPLFGVPFAALPLGSATSHLVIDDFIPSIAPSLTVLKEAPKRSAAVSALLVSVGEASAAESLPALPGAEAEIAAVATAYRRPTELSGRAATAAAILSAMPSADVVHFAGHAIADAAEPERSRLVVAGTGAAATITFDDLRRTRLRRGAIIVLSACDVARGHVFHGEGAVGLTYPFLANGASAVLASLWPIDDASPAALWQSFHARVSAGDPPDTALAESQRISRQHGVAPSAWAAFESVGGLAGQ